MENPVEYTVHKDIVAWLQRSNKRLFIIVLVLIALLAASWVGFFIYESQFEDVVITAEQSAETGDNYAVGGDCQYGIAAESNN